ncbi:GNAT family N-acetyltransferase [Cupriavidus necator]
MELERNFEVRAATQVDLGWWVALHSDAAFNRWIMRGSEGLRTLRDEFAFKLAAQRDHRGVFVVVEVDSIGRGYGVMLISVTRDSAHVEFGLDPRYQRKGIGGVLLDETLRAGCRIVPELTTIKAVCHRNNEGCIRLLRSRGFMSLAEPAMGTLPYLSWHLIVDAASPAHPLPARLSDRSQIP